MDTWHDSRRRYRHPPLGNPDFLHQQTRCLHEILIVQERLAHPPEHQIDAILGRRHLLVFEYSTHLPHDLARRQIALHPEQRRQTKLAIHSTTPLAGNANRRPPLILPLTVWRGRGCASLRRSLWLVFFGWGSTPGGTGADPLGEPFRQLSCLTPVSC